MKCASDFGYPHSPLVAFSELTAFGPFTPLLEFLITERLEGSNISTGQSACVIGKMQGLFNAPGIG